CSTKPPPAVSETSTASPLSPCVGPYGENEKPSSATSSPASCNPKESAREALAASPRRLSRACRRGGTRHRARCHRPGPRRGLARTPRRSSPLRRAPGCARNHRAGSLPRHRHPSLPPRRRCRRSIRTRLALLKPIPLGRRPIVPAEALSRQRGVTESQREGSATLGEADLAQVAAEDEPIEAAEDADDLVG